VVLGIIQGLTEFLPISSSAHLRIFPELFGWGDPGAAFTAVIQIGTELAVLIFFWRDIWRIATTWLKSLVRPEYRGQLDARMGWFIILGSVPIVVLGLIFQTAIETTLRSLWIVATTLIVFGILLGVADLVGAKRRQLEELTWPHAIIFGFAQALALIPGVSRSGGTMTGGLFLGYDRSAVARYSFLLAIPAVFGSGLFQLYKTVREPCLKPATGCAPEVFSGLETAVATGIAFVVGFLVIAFFMRYITRHSFLPFVIYRILLGGALVAMLTTGVLQAN
jgi:undecaprenyl-diphosphatase